MSGSYEMAPTRDVQPENMEDEEVTLSVVNKSEAYMVTRPEQLENIEDIFVTWAVLKLERFSEVRPEQ